MSSADPPRAGVPPGAPRERRGQRRHAVDVGIFASIDGQTVRLLNISHSGVAIRGQGLTTGSAHLLEFNLDHHHLAALVEIVDSSGTDRLHARFVQPEPALQQAIDRYVDHGTT
jgi:hypothetical protein